MLDKLWLIIALPFAGFLLNGLLLVGEQTPVAAKRASAILADALPSAVIHEVTGAGHMRVRALGRDQIQFFGHGDWHGGGATTGF